MRQGYGIPQTSVDFADECDNDSKALELP